jgi:hypothetical protein
MNKSFHAEEFGGSDKLVTPVLNELITFRADTAPGRCAERGFDALLLQGTFH